MLIVIFASGCATPNIKPGDTNLETNQGILVTRIHTNIKGGNALIHHKDQAAPSAKFEQIKAPKDLKVIKIESGEAQFSRIYWANLETWRKRSGYFVIKPGMINYVGDFVIEWNNKDGRLGVITLHIDREEETIKEAKSLYPNIFAKYKYRKSIPELKIKKVEGYESIDEVEAIKKKQETIEKAIENYVNQKENKEK